MSDASFVSVIVPVYNDAGRLAACLEALEDQTYASQRYEVVVVDNASSQPIATLLDDAVEVLGQCRDRQGGEDEGERQAPHVSPPRASAAPNPMCSACLTLRPELVAPSSR